MKRERIIKVYDVVKRDNSFISLLIVKKDNIYLLEKVFVKNDNVKLLFQKQYETFFEVNTNFNKLKIAN